MMLIWFSRVTICRATLVAGGALVLIVLAPLTWAAPLSIGVPGGEAAPNTPASSRGQARRPARQHLCPRPRPRRVRPSPPNQS